MSTGKHATLDHSALVAELAEGVGDVVPGKSDARIRAGNKTLCYANQRKAGLQLDFRAVDLEGAPAAARRRTTVRRNRALLTVTDKTTETARTLLRHVAQKAGA